MHFFRKHSSRGFPTELENHGNSRGGWGRGYDKHPLEWKFQGDGGSKTKVPSEGVWIFFGTTH